MSGNRATRAALDYNRLSLMLLFCVVAYNEFIVYYNYHRSWPEVSQEENVLKALLVADPQIQGASDMDNWLLGIITRWDSDRYLSKTFSWAKYAYAPDVVIFLGDLMDEGSESTDNEYFDYYKRFKGIYDTKAAKIFVAGDNDIGGEGTDPLTPEKVSRFKKYFPAHPTFLFQVSPEKVVQRYELEDEESEKYPIVEIVPANLLTFKSAEESWFGVSSQPHPSVKFRVVVSHMPILPNPAPIFSKEVMKYLHPSVIFSAHDHRGLDFTIVRDNANGKPFGNVTIFTQNRSFDDGDKDEPDEIKIHSSENHIHEIIVPTCSYRMGVKEMALGLVTIAFDKQGIGEVTYFNLWLPSRFPLLFVYLATLSISCTLFLIGRVKKRTNYAGGRRLSSTSTLRGRRGSMKTNAHFSKLV